MSDFGFYFQLGWEHIISLDALDHQLFILVLTILYTFNYWKKVFVLITAFTIGHSITLALSTLNIVSLSTELVELLIPCTIILTAILNMAKQEINQQNMMVKYLLAMVFGLIHGLGFANTLKYILAQDQTLGWSLLSFNIGLEVGQILIVFVLLCLSTLLLNRLKVNRKYLIVATSILAIIASLKIIIERL